MTLTQRLPVGRVGQLLAVALTLLVLLLVWEARVRSMSALLTGATDAVAAATLQGRVQDMAGSAGATLSSTEALPARQQGAYRRIALRVSLNASLPVLVRLLQSLDESTPRMLVDDLQCHTSPIVIAQAHQTSPALDASMTIIGFRAGQETDVGDSADAPGGDVSGGDVAGGQ